MKFEKFFKAVGTHGLIVKKSEVETWLVCAGVGMKIPEGVNNLGISQKPEEMFNAIINSPADDFLTLKEAVLLDPEGKANDIIRVFETDLGDRVGVYNANYGLIEKKDRLTYLEIEHEDEDTGKDVTSKYIVVRDYDNQVIGFIAGSDRI